LKNLPASKLIVVIFFEEVMAQYSDIGPWLKLHWTRDHLWLVPEKYGFLGRGNEQGFESFHVRTNNLAKVAQARLGKDQIAATLQKK